MQRNSNKRKYYVGVEQNDNFVDFMSIQVIKLIGSR